MRKYIKISLVFALLIGFLTVISYSIDSHRIKNNNDPILSLKVNVLKDGGSAEYIGLGYQVIKWNIVTESSTRKTGYELHPLFDFINLDEGPSIELNEKLIYYN